MYATPATLILAVTNLGLWGASLLETARKAEGAHLSTMALLAASPFAVAAAAALTVSLVVWRILGPLAVVWAVAERTGRQDAARTLALTTTTNVRELHPHA